MIKIKNQKKIFIQSFILMFCSFLFSVCIFFSNNFFDNLSSLLFVIFLASSFIFKILSKDLDEVSFVEIAFASFAIHFGVLLAHFLSGLNNESLWVIDSMTTHLPRSLEVTSFLKNFPDEDLTRPVFGRLYLTHFVTGFFFLFNVSPLVSGLVLCLFKTFSLYIILSLGTKVFSRQVGVLASLIYLFSPNILFYSITFYKDITVQFLFILSLFLFHKVMIEKSIKSIFPLLLTIFFLANERRYIVVTLFPSIVFFLFTYKSLSKAYRAIAMLVLTLGLFGIYEMFLSHYTFESIIPYIERYRISSNSFEYMNPKYTMNLSYPFSWIKLYFTPFFTFDKFSMFYEYSTLLIWGSFVHQAIMIIFGYGAYLIFKKDWKLTLFYILPFFLFMLVFAYVSAYSGRVRNSYYGVICIFAGYALQVRVLPWLKRYVFKNRCSND